MCIVQCYILFQQNCSKRYINKQKDRDAFDLHNIKEWGSLLYLDSFYSLISLDNIVIYLSFLHYVWKSSEIYSSYCLTFTMKIAHNTTLRFKYFLNSLKQEKHIRTTANMWRTLVLDTNLTEKYPQVFSSSNQLYRTQPGPMIRNGPLLGPSLLTLAESDICTEKQAVNLILERKRNDIFTLLISIYTYTFKMLVI